MTIGIAIFLGALGAILRYAVNDSISGIELATVGTILIVAGVVGLIAALAIEMSQRGRASDRDGVPRDRY